MRRALVLLLALSGLWACQGVPSDAELSTLDLSGLPRGFLLGTATAAHQVEGGNSNDWTDWENTSFPDGGPHIAGGDESGLADDSWNRFDNDLLLMKDLHANAYRFSVEWSRLEPSRGQWDEAAAARYRSWLVQLRANGIEPMVTLFHFTLPRWVAAQGGFESDQTMADFEAFTTRAALAFGDLVDVWCTINEPNVYAYSAYLTGEFPPGKKDERSGRRRAGPPLRRPRPVGARAAGERHRRRRRRRPGHVDRGRPPRARLSAGLVEHARHHGGGADRRLLQRVHPARARHRPGEALRARRARRRPAGRPNWRAASTGWASTTTRATIVRADLGDPTFSKQYVPEGRPTSQLGWESYPQGLYLMLKRFDAYGVPLYVTENGIADSTDTRRVAYLTHHLEALALARRDGADVRGYFHWSLLDNFEWAEGFAPRFGLYSVDYGSADFTRTPTKAVDTFRAAADQLKH